MLKLFSNRKLIVIIVAAAMAGMAAPALYGQDTGDEPDVTRDDGRGWVFGINFGMYFPSKYTAAYYNGRAENANNAKYVLSNYYWYQEIYNLLKAHDSIFIAGYPENMHYKITMRPGVSAQYCFNDRFSLSVEFNYMKLVADDALSIEVDPKPFATEPDLRLYKIRGMEERVYADIGARQNFSLGGKVVWFATGGLNVNSTRVQKSSFYVEEKEYSMINTYGNSTYIPGSYNQSFSVYQGGIGVGMFAGGGGRFTFGNSLHIESGITAHWLKVNLERYKRMRPGAGIYLRFLF